MSKIITLKQKTQLWQRIEQILWIFPWYIRLRDGYDVMYHHKVLISKLKHSQSFPFLAEKITVF